MRRGEKGFTLIELVLVIVILGIVASVAIPSVKGVMDEALLDEAVQEVVNMLRYGRDLAMHNNTSRIIDFDPAQESCTLLTGYVSSGNNLLRFDNEQNPPASETWGVRNIRVSNGDTVLLADNNGYGNIPGGDTSHVDRVDYNFNGSGENIKLAYSLYDSDTAEEIAIYFNGARITDAGKGINSNWTKTRTIDLPVVVTGDASVINELDKKAASINFNTSPRLSGVDIVSALFGMGDDIIFHSDGSPSQGGTVVLLFRGRSKTITVESVTGRISVQ
ncbi:MAG: prepilin-type N-terminal cleavage/methylation domain-containing protein [Nitrospirae bacterium]|nr:prepilin-type N-terminal cleavage/methylation domain-containing protein [Nitrospirota bacterium]